MVILVGYHGTFVDCINDILSGSFKVAEKDDHYLGMGIYFFKDDLEEARTWAYLQIKKKKSCEKREVAVIKANIEVNEDNLLNLTTRSGMEKIICYSQKFINDSSNKIRFNENNVNRNRSFLIDYISKKYKYQVVLCAFEDAMNALRKINNEINVSIGLYPIQICVKEEGLIKNKECVYMDGFRSTSIEIDIST
jgi:hypothetical protein